MLAENGMFIKPQQVAARLGVSPVRVYQMCAEGILPHVRFGRSVRIPVLAFERWADDQVKNALANVGGSHAEAA